MRYLSVCSGIEAATVAWHHMGWVPAAFSEIEKFPSAVLAHHYPNVPNWGDMTKFKEWPDANIDVLVGGTPCQSFSVAGLRKGLDDPRGNLMLTFGSIAQRYRPQWLVWENVPGVLSSNGGRDFGSFLGMLGQLGYGFAYRVLDAQYFGVAQRRRRVFVVGHLGDWHRAAAVLFERHSLSGNPAPSRQARQRTSGDFAPSVAGSLDTQCGGGKLTHQSMTNGHVIGKITARMFNALGARDVEEGALLPVASAFKVRGGVEVDADGKSAGKGYLGSEECAFTLARTQDQWLAQPVAFHNRQDPDVSGDITHPIGAKDNGMAVAIQGTVIGRSETAGPQGSGADASGAMFTLTKTDVHAVAIQDVREVEKAQNGKGWNDDGSAYTVDTHATQGVAVAFGGDIARSLTARHDSSPCADRGMDVVAVPFGVGESPDVGHCLRSGASKADKHESTTYVQTAMQVRRLTPVECERLQGFPDGYTNIPWRKKTESPDGPRYKALGNSMAVPVMRWIGERIAAVEKL